MVFVDDRAKKKNIVICILFFSIMFCTPLILLSAVPFEKSADSETAAPVDDRGAMASDSGPRFENSHQHICVFAGGGPFDITTSQGEPVVEESYYLYIIKADGSREQIGAASAAEGDYEKQYFLADGTYHFVKTGGAGPEEKNADAAETRPVSFWIDYIDGGSLKKSVEYDKLDIPAVELTVGDHTLMETVCRVDEASGVIEPTRVLTAPLDLPGKVSRSPGEAVAIESRQNSQQERVINEKGWLVGPEYDHLSKAISVLVGGGQFDVVTSRGEPVVMRGESVYKIKADGFRELVGTTNIAGTDYERQYFLVNDDYTFVKTGAAAPDGENSAETKPISFKIEYIDSGYLKKVIKYERLDIQAAELLVRSHALMETVCRSVIEPTFLETGFDLGAK
jgi:hypothetical protein